MTLMLPASPTRRRLRPIAMLVHSYYEEDPRVRREAEALVAAGHEVDVFSLCRPGDPPEGALEGVHITRLDVQRHQGSPIATYLLEYADFTARSTFALARAHRGRRYGLVQVHTPPDFLVVAALPLRLLGVPVILDLHEAVPEFFRSRWPGLANGAILAGLAAVERAAISMATLSFSVNQARHDRLLRLGVPAARLRVVTNGPVLARFDPTAHPKRAFMEDGTLRLAYAGALTPLYGLDDVLAAMARLATERPALRVELDLYGRGDEQETLEARAAALGLVDRVRFRGRVPIDAVAGHLAAADVILSPIRRTRFSEISLSTKAIEGAVMGKPVVAADMPTARHYFPGEDLAWYAPDDPAGMAAAILRLVDDAPARSAAVARAAVTARGLAWDREAEAYVGLVETLLRTSPSLWRPHPRRPPRRETP
jgi:glycosyltransferase involved in cell wall biosynthesis